MPVTRKGTLQWWSDSKNSQKNFTWQGYLLSFKGGTLLLGETVTMLRGRDVIHWGIAFFGCMIHVCVSVIIHVPKKKELLFDIPSYTSCNRIFAEVRVTRIILNFSELFPVFKSISALLQFSQSQFFLFPKGSINGEIGCHVDVLRYD